MHRLTTIELQYRKKSPLYNKYALFQHCIDEDEAFVYAYASGAYSTSHHVLVAPNGLHFGLSELR